MRKAGFLVLALAISSSPLFAAATGGGSPTGSTYDFELASGEHSTNSQGLVTLYDLDTGGGDNNVTFDGVAETIEPYCCNLGTTPTVNESLVDNGNGTKTITITATVPAGKDLFPSGLAGTNDVSLTDGGLIIGHSLTGDALDWTPSHVVVSSTLDVLAGPTSIFQDGAVSLDPGALFGAPGPWSGFFSVGILNGAGHGSTRAVLTIVYRPVSTGCTPSAGSRCIDPVASPTLVRIERGAPSETPFSTPPPPYVAPPLSFRPLYPAGGQAATVTAALPDATSVQLTFSGPGCGSFANQTGPGAQLVVQQIVGPFGSCSVRADFATPTGTQTYARGFTVEPTAIELPATEVPDADFVPGDLPPPSGGPGIASINAPGTLINGGTVTLRMNLSDPGQAANIREALVKVPGAAGYDGYWETPVTLDGSTVLVNISLSPNFTPSSQSTLSARIARRFLSQWVQASAGIAVTVELEDSNGDFGDPSTLNFQTQEVTPGSVTVGLSWDTPTDLDLHVVDPNGVEIYYANRSADGGSLDLDSNAACSIDGINNEHITWPSAAPAGQYTVRVDFWSDCPPSQGQPGLPADWTVTTSACGTSQTFTGSFAAGASDRGSAGSGVTVTTFTADCGGCSGDTLARQRTGLAASQCQHFRVRGQASFEKRMLDQTGLSPDAVNFPIGGAHVVVKKVSDGSELPGAEGVTAIDGTFDLSFSGSNPGQVQVQVLAESRYHGEPGKLDQQVVNAQGLVWNVFSDQAWDPAAEPDKTDVMVFATIGPANNAAPAFNLYRAGVRGSLLYLKGYGTAPGPLTFQWQPGQRAPCGGADACEIDSRIYISSIDQEAKAYSDSIVLHEYGHFWEDQVGLSQPAGAHTWTDRTNRFIAWSEGVATLYGQLALGSDMFVGAYATDNGGIYIAATSVETLADNILRGTSDGTRTGLVNEWTITAILWDISDPAGFWDFILPERVDSNNVGYFDTVYRPAAVFRVIGLMDKTDSDLVDFLDTWCSQQAGGIGSATQGLQGIVSGINQFPYQFATICGP